MQRCQEREAREEGAQENTAPLCKGASLPFLSLQALLFVTGHGLKPWKTDYTQEQGFNFQLPPPTLAQAGESEHQQSDAKISFELRQILARVSEAVRQLSPNFDMLDLTGLPFQRLLPYNACLCSRARFASEGGGPKRGHQTY